MSTPTTLFVGGRWMPAAAGATREIHCPADRSIVGVVSEAGKHDVDEAIAAARRAFNSGGWSYETSASERGDLLLRVASNLRSHTEELARAESLDTGKRLAESSILQQKSDPNPGRFSRIGHTAAPSLANGLSARGTRR